MIHKAVMSGPVRSRSRRSGAARGRLTVASVHVAAFALFAHLLVVSHTVSHLSRGFPEGASQHCAICAIGTHSAAIPTASIAGCQCAALWVMELAGRPVAPLLQVEESTLARGPPFSALAAIG